MKKYLLLLFLISIAGCSSSSEELEGPSLPYSQQEYTEEENLEILSTKLESLNIILDFGISLDSIKSQIDYTKNHVDVNTYIDPDLIGKFYKDGFVTTPGHGGTYAINYYNILVRPREVPGFDKDYGISQPIVGQAILYEETPEKDKPYFQTQVMATSFSKDTYDVVKNWALTFTDKSFIQDPDRNNVEVITTEDFIIEIEETDDFIVVRFYDTRIPYFIQY